MFDFGCGKVTLAVSAPGGSSASTSAGHLTNGLGGALATDEPAGFRQKASNSKRIRKGITHVRFWFLLRHHCDEQNAKLTRAKRRFWRSEDAKGERGSIKPQAVERKVKSNRE